MARLKTKEIEAIVAKIRQRHEEGAVRFGGAGFSRKGFDDRYLQVLRDKVDLQTFVFAEVGAIEELTRRAQKAEEDARVRTELPFTKRIEAMLRGMSDKIRGYPAILSEADLPEEVNHFAGGLRAFLDEVWFPLRAVIQPDDLKSLKTYGSLTERIERFCVHSKGRLPFEVEKFTLEAGRNGEDKARMAFLREAAVILREITVFLDGMPETPAGTSAREFAGRLVADFRFGDFV
jgi:hypothetical protein